MLSETSDNIPPIKTPLQFPELNRVSADTRFGSFCFIDLVRVRKKQRRLELQRSNRRIHRTSIKQYVLTDHKACWEQINAHVAPNSSMVP